MDVLNLTKVEFKKILSTGAIVGKGMDSKLIEISDNMLIKITGDSNVQKVKKLIKKKDIIKRTKLTQGIVYVEDKFVGYLVYYHKDKINLYDYLNNYHISEKDIEIIIKQIKEIHKELIENYIYVTDVSSANFMINTKTKEIQAIDFEDDYTKCLNKENLKEKEEIMRKIANLEYEMELYKKREYVVMKSSYGL